jgi:hypothetical protein
MALPKKGTRKITVDGEVYRWLIRKQPTDGQGAFVSQMTFAVEHIRESRRTLVVGTRVPRPDNWLRKPSASVTPAHVAEAIRKARGSGWEPGLPGSAFMMDFDILGCQQDAPPNRRPARQRPARASRSGGGR